MGALDEMTQALNNYASEIKKLNAEHAFFTERCNQEKALQACASVQIETRLRSTLPSDMRIQFFQYKKNLSLFKHSQKGRAEARRVITSVNPGLGKGG